MPKPAKSKKEDLKEPVTVPPELPAILKDYSKAILKNNPDDIFDWSARYFDRLAKLGAQKDPALMASFNVTPGSLKAEAAKREGSAQSITVDGIKALNFSFLDLKFIPLEQLEHSWSDAGWSELQLEELLSIGDFYTDSSVSRLKFIAITCSSLMDNRKKSLSLAVEVLNAADGKKGIGIEKFEEMYRFLADLDEVPDDIQDSTVRQIGEES